MVRFEMDASNVVSQADPKERRWGYHQFPFLRYDKAGNICLYFHMAEDDVTAYGKKNG